MSAYCGIGKLPKNKRFGTMTECKEMGQVKRYGMIRVDKRVIEKSAKDKIGETRNKILLKSAQMRGKIKRIKRELENKELDKKIKKEKEAQLEKEKKLLKSAIAKFKKVEEKNKKEAEIKKKEASVKKTVKKRVEKKPKQPVKRTPIESVFLKSPPKKKKTIPKVLYDNDRWNNMSRVSHRKVKYDPI